MVLTLWVGTELQGVLGFLPGISELWREDTDPLCPCLGLVWGHNLQGGPRSLFCHRFGAVLNKGVPEGGHLKRLGEPRARALGLGQWEEV